MDKYNLYELESRARDMWREADAYHETHVVRFDFCGPKGRLAQRFLDVHMGLISDDVDHPPGFSMLSDLRRVAPDLWVENLRVEKIVKTEAA